MNALDPTLLAPSLGALAADGPIVPVILSGGSGTRLWPVSRESFPKQFWPLIGERSMIAETVARGLGRAFAPAIVVCNEEHRFLVAEQMRQAGAEGARILLEPVGRNSAPAVTAAALLVAELDPEAVLWMMAADAAIGDTDQLHRLLARAVVAARAGKVVTFGMHPTAPETGYGYIEVGERLDGLTGVHALTRFAEKPDAAAAAAMIASGTYLWNSGMYVFTAATLLAEMRRHAPDVLAAVGHAMAERTADLDFIRLAEKPFRACPSISIDVAIAERTDRAAVVPAELGWSDVGSWNALWDLGVKDTAGNVGVGDVMLQGSHDCYVRSDGILTAVVGLRDVVVVVTEDAVLVMDRARSQDVKLIVERLRAERRHEAVAHNRVYRPWGFHEELISGDRFNVQRIVIEPGQKLSMQRHYNRAEHWVVVHGTALVTRDGEQSLVREDESLFLPIGTVHRLENPGRIPLTLIEVRSGSYLGEDDVERLPDVIASS